MRTIGGIPQLGLGTYGRTGDEGAAALLKGIEIGYRHLDTAQNYDTEKQVGLAIRASGLPREDFFVTTKVGDARLDKASFMPSVERSVEAIGVGPVDLLLIHWPSEKDTVPFEHYMLALAEAKQLGHTRLIGVSNFPIALLKRTESLLGKGALATNQIEIHPYLQSPKIRDYARSITLPLTAYQPLVKGRVTHDPVLQRIGAAHGVSACAAALAFLIAEGHIVIPASASAANLHANFQALNVALSEGDIADIRKLDRGDRCINPAKAPHWDD